MHVCIPPETTDVTVMQHWNPSTCAIVEGPLQPKDPVQGMISGKPESRIFIFVLCTWKICKVIAFWALFGEFGSFGLLFFAYSWAPLYEDVGAPSAGSRSGEAASPLEGGRAIRSDELQRP